MQLDYEHSLSSSKHTTVIIRLQIKLHVLVSVDINFSSEITRFMNTSSNITRPRFQY